MAAESKRGSNEGRKEGPMDTGVRLVPTRIFVKDFGPVREADIDLRRVTILMGPNNTGKTFTTVLMLVLNRFITNWGVVVPFLLSFKQVKFTKVLQTLRKNLVTDLVTLYSVGGPEELVRRGSDRAELRFVLRPEGDVFGDTLELEIRIHKPGAVFLRIPEFKELLKTKNIQP
jgi:hypothetical protein